MEGREKMGNLPELLPRNEGYDVELTEEESEEESEEEVEEEVEEDVDYEGDLYTYQNLLKIKIVSDYTFYMYYFDFDKGIEVEPINCHIKNIEYDINGLIKNIYFEDEDEEIRFSYRDLYQWNEDLKNTMISEFNSQSCLDVFESLIRENLEKQLANYKYRLESDKVLVQKYEDKLKEYENK